jgi:hypothetical protein
VKEAEPEEEETGQSPTGPDSRRPVIPVRRAIQGDPFLDIVSLVIGYTKYLIGCHLWCVDFLETSGSGRPIHPFQQMLTAVQLLLRDNPDSLS